jgi:trk system potassium uptake protein
MGWTLVTRVLSGIVLALGLSLFVPVVLSLLYADGSWESFLLPATAMVLVGAGGLRVSGSSDYRSSYVSNRDVYLSVTLAWLLSALLGRVPFLIEGTFDSPLDHRGNERVHYDRCHAAF